MSDTKTGINRLLQAYAVLFLDGDMSLAGNISNLTLQDLKKAYRRMIFENHPDRAKVLGINEKALLCKSQEITASYQHLTSFLQGDRRRYYADRRSQSHHERKSPRSNANNYKRKSGPIDKAFFQRLKKYDVPPVQLKTGQFLHYLKVISYKTLLDAINWQKSQTRDFGAIARDMNLFSNEDARLVVTNKKKGEKIGECALRMGILTEDEVSLILETQKKERPRIGRYFIKQHIISEEELRYVLEMLAMHNIKHANPKKSPAQ